MRRQEARVSVQRDANGVGGCSGSRADWRACLGLRALLEVEVGFRAVGGEHVPAWGQACPAQHHQAVGGDGQGLAVQRDSSRLAELLGDHHIWLPAQQEQRTVAPFLLHSQSVAQAHSAAWDVADVLDAGS